MNAMVYMEKPKKTVVAKQGHKGSTEYEMTFGKGDMIKVEHNISLSLSLFRSLSLYL